MRERPLAESVQQRTEFLQRVGLENSQTLTEEKTHLHLRDPKHNELCDSAITEEEDG